MGAPQEDTADQIEEAKKKSTDPVVGATESTPNTTEDKKES